MLLGDRCDRHRLGEPSLTLYDICNTRLQLCPSVHDFTESGGLLLERLRPHMLLHLGLGCERKEIELAKGVCTDGNYRRIWVHSNNISLPRGETATFLCTP